MLLAGAMTSICLRIMRYEMETFLWILLMVLIVFYIIGSVVRHVLDSFEAERKKAEKEAAEKEAAEKEVSDEGEVIMKEETPDTAGKVTEGVHT